MPATSPPLGNRLKKVLSELGERLRERRKRLGISAVAAAEAAGISRITLHRIEKGEPSIVFGSYLNIISALGLEFDLVYPQDRDLRKQSLKKIIPKKIKLSDWPELKRLAWQTKSSKELSPIEALEIYERNWRHVDIETLSTKERELIQALLETFDRGRLLV